MVKAMILTRHFFRIKHLDVYSTVTQMNSQGMTMLVETADQYLDIFQRLKDELTSRKLPPGYFDLDQMNGQNSVDIDLESVRSSLSQEENEFAYPEEDSDQEGEVGVVAYYTDTDIVTTEDRKDAHDSTNTANYTIERSQPSDDAEHTRIRSLPLD